MWTVDSGLWTVDSGQWTVNCGLWTVNCGLLGISGEKPRIEGRMLNADENARTQNSPLSTVHCPLSNHIDVFLNMIRE